MDAKAAFSTGGNDRDVFVYYPYNLSYDPKRSTVHKLCKVLYGLRQAPLQFFKKLTDYLIQQSKLQLPSSDSAVFVKKIDRALIIILAYVDDFLLFENTALALDTAIPEFLTHFDGSTEPLERYLRVHFNINFDFVQLSQASFIQQAFKNMDY